MRGPGLLILILGLFFAGCRIEPHRESDSPSASEDHEVGIRVAEDMVSFCNPMDLDYRFSGNGRWREAADPVILLFRDDFYLFASKCGGYYWSSDMKDWTFVRPIGMPKDAIESYAPAATVIGDELYYLVGRENSLYKSSDPKNGIWRHVVGVRFVVDPTLFLDDDGRLYMFWGYGSIRGIELDPRKGFREIGHPVNVFTPDVANRGWEGSGDDNLLERTADSPGRIPWTEGAWVSKHQGKYYLQASAPATHWVTYASGLGLSENILGEYEYANYSPVALKSTGFAPGAGHGCEFADKDGVRWRAKTGVISHKDKFERRLNLFRAGFDQDGYMFSDTYLACLPQYLPHEGNGDASTDNLVGWMLLSYGKKAQASSTLSGNDVANAFDENIKTFWSSSKEGKPSEEIVKAEFLTEGGWNAEYFNNTELQGEPVLVRHEAAIDYSWKDKPSPSIPKDNFSVRWSGMLEAPASGTYTFLITGDDGMNLYIDGQKVIDDWSIHATQTAKHKKELVGGKKYAFVVEHFDSGGDATAKFSWKTPRPKEKMRRRADRTGEWLSVDLEKICTVNAIQVNHADAGASNTSQERDGAFRYVIEHSIDGREWQITVDKSLSDRDAPHEYMELRRPVQARHFRISEVETPYGARFSIRDFRIFGKAPGTPPEKVVGVRAVRKVDARNVELSWKPVPGAEGYVIRYGIAPDKLYNSYMVRGQSHYQINSLNVGVGYYFTIDSFNPSGINKGTRTVRVQ